MNETEADTRANRIDPVLRAAGWGVVEGSRIRREMICPGRIITGGARRSATPMASAKPRITPSAFRRDGFERTYATAHPHPRPFSRREKGARRRTVADSDRLAACMTCPLLPRLTRT